MNEDFNIKQLDNALTKICEGKTESMYNENWYTEEISNQLKSAGYIKSISRNFDNTEDDKIEVTERGRFFYASGGYLHQYQVTKEHNEDRKFLEEERKYREEERINISKDRLDQKRNRWISTAAIITSAFCALLQLFVTCCK